MKVFLSVLLTGSFAFAAEKNCADFAQGVAEYKYLTEATGIQGHEYDVYVRGYSNYTDTKTKKTTGTAEVYVEGNNDEGDQWETMFQVIVDASDRSCKLIEISDGMAIDPN